MTRIDVSRLENGEAERAAVRNLRERAGGQVSQESDPQDSRGRTLALLPLDLAVAAEAHDRDPVAGSGKTAEREALAGAREIDVDGGPQRSDRRGYQIAQTCGVCRVRLQKELLWLP